MAIYSTSQAAKKCGVHHITLQRWVSQGKVAAPKKTRVGGVVVRLWTDADVDRLRKYKQRNYRKGRGRKAKSKR
jgi:DNA-binding transcriptional MerR regulator